jgi:hypothetical protein
VCVHTIIVNGVLFAGEIPGLRTQTQRDFATSASVVFAAVSGSGFFVMQLVVGCNFEHQLSLARKLTPILERLLARDLVLLELCQQAGNQEAALGRRLLCSRVHPPIKRMIGSHALEFPLFEPSRGPRFSRGCSWQQLRAC